MEEIDAIPLMCSKCQMSFEKESDYSYTVKPNMSRNRGKAFDQRHLESWYQVRFYVG